MLFRRLSSLLVLLVALVASPVASQATQIVAPVGLENTNGNASGSGGLFGTSPVTYQFQIAASELATMGLTPNSSISAILQRLDTTVLASAIGTSLTLSTSIQITFAQAANPIDSMSLTFADNMLNPVVVFNGLASVTLTPSAAQHATNAPNPFSERIDFTTPYVYQGGDLVLMWARLAVPNAPNVDSHDTSPTPSILYSRVIAGSVSATGSLIDNRMHVIALEATAGVPEPGSGLLALTALIALPALRRYASRGRK